ncbi:hypothetical protein DASB73_001560 [Starmerella bacillaris]|uniref:Uncharacterized protein n=1 Tax=Starmerella bacillaris TaxID=1247836 RepID=A0AAV5REM5_STABA|nr:hypothetical protein DASB73_001560 [Starmerella bacillaris]
MNPTCQTAFKPTKMSFLRRGINIRQRSSLLDYSKKKYQDKNKVARQYSYAKPILTLGQKGLSIINQVGFMWLDWKNQNSSDL